MKPTGAENMSLGLNIKVDGSVDIKLHKKHNDDEVVNTTSFGQKAGVPVLVDPVLMGKTGVENATLGLNMRIGPDDVSI
jgi:hypothetical protein